MKKILLATLILLFSIQSFAFLVESGFIQQNNGSYVKATQITCSDADQNFCQNLCQKESQCIRVEPYCRNCAGTSSALLRQLFTEISRIYKIKGEIQNKNDLIPYLAKEAYILLDLKSIFNYYTPVGAEAFIKELQEFCGIRTEDSLLAITLDSMNQPKELKYVLCRSLDNQTTTYSVEERVPSVGGPRLLMTPLFFELM